MTFPPAHFADRDGLIAIGGDLSPERIIQAYKSGIFFWFGPMDPIKWWSPDPRMVIFPGQTDQIFSNEILINLKIDDHASLNSSLQLIKENENKDQMGPNWLTEEMCNLYLSLFKKGYLHIIEVFEKEIHIGSILGLAIGKAFLVEYLYCPEKNEERIHEDMCMKATSEYLLCLGFKLIDIQKDNINISDIGISEIPRIEYLDLLKQATEFSSNIIKMDKTFALHVK